MYLFSYFRTEAEALHLALSEDGFTFEALNGNAPVLSASGQVRTIRDPYIFRDDNGRFHLLATGGWDRTDLVHGVSNDLVTWSDLVNVPVMADVPGTRNVWAPEAFAGDDGKVRLIWSSTVSVDGPEKLRDHRIWACDTTDFETFSAPRLFFDPGYDVIDATVARFGDAYLMAFKDERGENRVDTEFKAIRMAMSLRPDGPYASVSDLVTPAPVEGPTLYRKDGLWLMLYDHFIEHRYGASLSEDGREWQVSEIEVILPDGPRHGSVIEVSDEVGTRLKDHYG